MTGLTQFAHVAEMNNSPTVGEHPLATSAQAKVRAAEARLALVDADRRDPVELGVGVTRERSVFGESGQNAVRLSVRIPFGGDDRDASRLAAAARRTRYRHGRHDRCLGPFRQGHRHRRIRRFGVLPKGTGAGLCRRSGRCRRDFVRPGRGVDLPTRLRADSERFDAELALARARAEQQRAVSRLRPIFRATAATSIFESFRAVCLRVAGALLLVTTATLPLPALAGGDASDGHAHDAAPATTRGPALPRFTAQSDLFELVGVLNSGELSMLIDRYDSSRTGAWSQGRNRIRQLQSGSALPRRPWRLRVTRRAIQQARHLPDHAHHHRRRSDRPAGR